jgi:hypothetical protein
VFPRKNDSVAFVCCCRADRLSNEKARAALQNKCRVLEHEVDVWKRQKDFEVGEPHQPTQRGTLPCRDLSVLGLGCR